MQRRCGKIYTIYAYWPHIDTLPRAIEQNKTRIHTSSPSIDRLAAAARRRPARPSSDDLRPPPGHAHHHAAAPPPCRRQHVTFSRHRRYLLHIQHMFTIIVIWIPPIWRLQVRSRSTDIAKVNSQPTSKTNDQLPTVWLYLYTHAMPYIIHHTNISRSAISICRRYHFRQHQRSPATNSPTRSWKNAPCTDNAHRQKTNYHLIDHPSTASPSPTRVSRLPAMPHAHARDAPQHL